jgi:Tol biopolymer transport system component
MPLDAGTRLGPYEIVAALGAGGMGEVYRARDTRLDRTVAVKVLKSTLESSPEFKQRFEREARTISQLNHPHICTLYDIGHHEGTDFLVMEYLEGESLAQRLTHGPLPLRDLLKIAVDILSGLEQAHRAGIVHRDLKPGNVMLTKTGAKLLDFGLAKPALAGAMASSGSAPLLSAAMTISSPGSPLTSAGTLVGTVQYMAPEQLEGKEADARSDIFAFGAMLYEMATGKRAFIGKSQIKVASAIMEDDPPAITAIQPGLPPMFEHVVRTCLQKTPDERYQSAHDIAVQLKWIVQAPAAKSGGMSKGVNRWLAAALAVCLLLCVAGYFVFRPRPAQPIALGILPTAGVTFNFSGLSGAPAFSPDGTRLAMVGTDASGARMLFVRSLGHSNVQAIQGTSGAAYPFWSPDGQKVAFFTTDTLKVADIAGGSVLQLSPVSEGRGGTWNERGDIVFGTRTTGLMRLPASGGTPLPLTKLTSSQSSHRFPMFYPDGEHVAFVVQGADRAHAYVASLTDPRPAEIQGVMSNVAFSGDHIFHVREDGTLLTQRFDSRRLSLDPNPEVVAKPVGYDGQFNYSAFTVAAQGAIAYEEGSGSTANEIVWLDRAGKQLGSLPDVLTDSGLGLRLSPRGDRLLYSVSNARRSDVWVVQLGRGTRTRVSLGPEGGATAVWSPDGTHVAYQNRIGGGNIIVRTSDGIGSERALTNLPGEVLPAGWSPDGKFIVFEYINSVIPNNAREIWVAPADGSDSPHAVLRGLSTFGTDLSPDGKWLAYTSDESGRLEVYVIPFDPHATVANSLAAGRWQISAEGGHQPRWSPSGKEIMYANPSLTTLYSAPVQTSAGRVERGENTKLFDLAPHAPWAFYDISRDGHIYMFRYVGRQSSPLTVLLNWRPAGN